MTAKRGFVPLVVLFGLLVPPALALELGAPAPPLRIKEWIKGDPVKLADGVGKNIYVIEFWATWCPPCRASIPHLTELQNRYRDQGVVIIGISSEDAEPVEKVTKFVKQWDEKIGYTIAVDDQKQTRDALMEPGDADIPWAFIVDRDGKVVWTGNPLRGLEEALGAVVAGNFDLQAARKAETRRRQERAAAKEVFKLMDEYTDLVVTSKLDSSSRALGQRIYTRAENLPQVLNAFSWFILTDPRVVERDLPLAMKAAERANTLTENRDPPIIDTYARALFETGKIDAAIAAQQRAIDLCNIADLKKDFIAAMERYQAANR